MDEVEETTVTSVGERLRTAREAANMSLEDVATATRIPTRHLQSLEIADYSKLPAPTYTVGFAKSYAAAVGLDKEEIADQLRAELGGTRPAAAHQSEVFEPADPARAMPRWLIFGALAAIVLVVLAATWLNRRSLDAPDDVALENLAGPEAPPVTQPVQGPGPAQGPVVITANEQVWIQVKDGTATLREGILEAGQSFEVPPGAAAPVLTTGKPEALRISVGTADAPPVGPAATTVSNVSLRPADLMKQPTAGSPPMPANSPPAQ